MGTAALKYAFALYVTVRLSLKYMYVAVLCII